MSTAISVNGTLYPLGADVSLEDDQPCAVCALNSNVCGSVCVRIRKEQRRRGQRGNSF